MLRERKHILWSVLAATVLTAAPAAQACDCLWPWNWFRQPATAMAPVTYASPAPACGSCAPVTTYMPITAYRTVYQPTAVTACQPVSSGCGLFNCCGLFGSQTTTYRPVTSVVYRPALVPYTTYRPVTTVAMPVTSCAPVCNPCSTPTTTYRLGTSYMPAVSTVPASSCAAGDCGAPVVRDYPSTTTPSTTVAPSATTAPSQAPTTFKEGAQNNSGLQVVPQSSTNTAAPFVQPQLIRPNVSPASQSAVRQAVYYRPMSMHVSAAGPAAEQKPRLDTGGWHTVRN
ncbi:MAG: hypothetical protein HUU20_24725 [Pirellulales bacterium]|nr:hypothetical protein [Pirellulales bacterium]